MMNADIKLFLMGLGYTIFDELNDKEVCACFEYAGMEGYKVPVWGEIQKQLQWLNIDFAVEGYDYSIDFKIINVTEILLSEQSFTGKVNIWEYIESMLAVAICLASCVLMITQDDGFHWFEAYHFVLYLFGIHQWNFLQNLLVTVQHNLSQTVRFVRICVFG